jgi:hypothetical protein
LFSRLFFGFIGGFGVSSQFVLRTLLRAHNKSGKRASCARSRMASCGRNRTLVMSAAQILQFPGESLNLKRKGSKRSNTRDVLTMI